MVIDIDGQAGMQTLRTLIAAHGPLSTKWTRTGGGGWYAYLSHPGATVPSSASRIGEGLDVRGDGGYVVAPPSRHWSGYLYRWAVSPDCALHADHPAPVPRWLLDLATPPARRHSEAAPGRLSAVRASAYAAAAVEREAHEVAHAPVGQRNYRLNRAAFRLGQLVGAGLLQETTAADALVAAGLAAGPGKRKIRSTVSRGLEAGRRQPRRIVLHASQPRTSLP